MNIIGLERIGVTTAQSIGKEKMAATGDTPRLSPVRVRQIARSKVTRRSPWQPGSRSTCYPSNTIPSLAAGALTASKAR